MLLALGHLQITYHQKKKITKIIKQYLKHKIINLMN